MTPEEERLENIKQFWQEYRWTIIGGVVLGACMIGGWTGWQEYSRIQQESASTIFQKVAVAVVAGDADVAEQSAQELLEKHAGTSYAATAQILLARSRFESEDAQGAKDVLRDVLNSTDESSIEHLARIRLAQILIEQSEFQETLDLLDLSDLGGADSQYHELRGDAYRGLNQIERAHEEYQLSMDHLSPTSQYSPILAMKLNDTKIQN